MQGVGTRLTLLLGTDNLDGTFTGVTSGTTVPIDSGAYDETTFVVEATADTISAGALKMEEATRANYSGLWSQMGSTIDATAYSGTAQQQAFHITPSAMNFVRMRISTTLTGGGKVLVWLRQRGT